MVRSLFVFAALVLLVPQVDSQSQICGLLNDVADSNFGHSVSDAGDVDKDGYTDFIAGAPSSSGPGSAKVVSGVDGTILHALTSPLLAKDHYGYAVSDAGDVNNDGTSDLIVGAPLGFGGRAYVHSGANGSILHTFASTQNSSRLGQSVSTAGDVDLDGYIDLIVGEQDWDDNVNLLVNVGRAMVYSGKTGTSIYPANQFKGTTENQQVGTSVSDAGSVNLDAWPDFIIGDLRRAGTASSFFANRDGGATVYSGKGGTIIHTMTSAKLDDFFGLSVSGGGDISGDGVPDVVVGTLKRTVHVYWDLYTTVQTTALDNASSRSHSVDFVGDINSDGYDEVVVGDTPSAGARLVSGIDGTILFSLSGSSRSNYGQSVSGAGDVNGDGIPDVVVGANSWDDPESSSSNIDQGMAFVYSGTPLALTADVHQMSVSEASTQNINIDAGADNALANYWIFTNFAASGNSPGVTVAPGVTIPLNPDAFLTFTYSITRLGGGAPTLMGWKSTLNASGQASASINTSGPIAVGIGESFNHAALVYTANGCGVGCDTFQLATNWVPLTMTP